MYVIVSKGSLVVVDYVKGYTMVEGKVYYVPKYPEIGRELKRGNLQEVGEQDYFSALDKGKAEDLRPVQERLLRPLKRSERVIPNEPVEPIKKKNK